jgi:hypothetical protein
MSGFLEGLGDFVTVGIGDVGNSYQEMLMADASIGVPDALPMDYETTTTTVDYPAPEAAQLEPYEPPTTEAIPGLDIG